MLCHSQLCISVRYRRHLLTDSSARNMCTRKWYYITYPCMMAVSRSFAQHALRPCVPVCMQPICFCQQAGLAGRAILASDARICIKQRVRRVGRVVIVNGETLMWQGHPYGGGIRGTLISCFYPRADRVEEVDKRGNLVDKLQRGDWAAPWTTKCRLSGH